MRGSGCYYRRLLQLRSRWGQSVRGVVAMLVSWASIHGNLTHAGQSIRHCKTVKVTVLKSMLSDNGGHVSSSP